MLLREIIKTLKKKHAKSQDAVAITASTGVFPLYMCWNQLMMTPLGIAACNIGGVTIHSFAGVGIAVEQAAELVSKVKKNKKALARWNRTKVLIIDEGMSDLYPRLYCVLI